MNDVYVCVCVCVCVCVLLLCVTSMCIGSLARLCSLARLFNVRR